MLLHSGYKINIQNQKIGRHLFQSSISATWKSSKSRIGFHMRIDLKIRLKFLTKEYMYLKKKMTKSHKNTTKRQIRILSCTNWMKNWTWPWNKWSKRFKIWRRNTKIRLISSRKNAVFATTWSKWTFRISPWPTIKWMLASMRPLIASRHLNLSYSPRTRPNSSSRALQIWRGLSTRRWKTIHRIIFITTTKGITRIVSCSSLWMISTTTRLK